MSTLEYLSFPLKITDKVTEFKYTLKSCGFNKKMIQFLLHNITWNSNLIESDNKYLAVKYFDSPSTFFSLLTHFWKDLGKKQVFPEWLRLIMETTPSFESETINNQNKNRLAFDRLHNIAYKRINSLSDNDEVDQYTQARTVVDDDATVLPSDKAWSSARKEFKNNLKKYIRYVSSWPLHDDEQIFDEYKEWLRNSLLIRENSELELEFIEIYRSLENNLASLTNYKMNGKGLPPMILTFGENNENKNEILSNDFKNKDLRKKWKDNIKQLYEKYEDALDEFEGRDFLKKRFEEEMEKELQRIGAKEQINLVKNEFRTKINNINLETYKKKMENAYKAIIDELSQQPYVVWPTSLRMPTNDNGVIDRWYAWASQYWMTNVYSNWFLSVGKMSRSYADTSTMFRATQIVILDDSSYNISRFGKYALVPLNMPQLIYVYTLRNESPWWRPPQMTWEELSSKTEVEIDVESIKQEKDRINIIQKRLDNIKESLNEGLMIKKGNVVLYTTSPEFIGYCLFKNINIIIYNTWLKQTPIEIETLREQVLRQSGLLGKMVTRMAPEKTLLLTYIVLMALSCSNGIPMYVGFGWNNVFKQWFGLVKEYQKLVPPSRTNPEETCAWLARMGSTDKSIILNKKLLSPLISRILQSKFAPDKPVTKLNSDYGLWVRKYEELIEEKRISTGRVEPCVVMKMWTPDTHFLYKSREKITELLKKQIIEEGKKKKEEIITQNNETKEENIEPREDFDRRMKKWEEDKKKWITDKKKLWDTKREIFDIELERKKEKYDKNFLEWREIEEQNMQAMAQLNAEISRIEKELSPPLNDSLYAQLNDKQKKLNETNESINKLGEEIEKLEEEKKKWEQEAYLPSIRTWKKEGNLQGKKDQLKEKGIEKIDLDGSIQIITAVIDSKKAELDLYQKRKKEVEKTIIEHENKKPQKDVNVQKELETWEVDNPAPVEDDYEPEKPKRATLEDENKQEEMIINFDNINLDDSEPIDLDDLSLDIFSIDTVDELDENVDWADRVEWLYAQRQIFQTEYYAPKDLEEILLRFRIRLKDWTGAETITINN